MAGWGSGKQTLPAGDHLAQIRDWKQTKSQPRNPNEEPKDQFEWGLDIQIKGQWKARKIWTGQDFCDPTGRDPQFIPKLVKLVHACGLPLPKSPAEAAAWDPNAMIGRQFVIHVEEDTLTGKVTETYRAVQGAAQNAGAGMPAAQPAPPTPAPTSDPFVGDAGATPREPALAGAGATSAASASDPW